MWHACRQQDKALKSMVVDHRKKAERKKEYFASKFQDPVQSLKITNCGMEVKKDSKAHGQNEASSNLYFI